MTFGAARERNSPARAAIVIVDVRCVFIKNPFNFSFPRQRRPVYNRWAGRASGRGQKVTSVPDPGNEGKPKKSQRENQAFLKFLVLMLQKGKRAGKDSIDG
jgi:hypothetical protein